MAIGRSPVSLADLITAGLLKPGEELRLRGQADLTARVLSDGRLETSKGVFTSPTTAANKLQGGSSNGWRAWRAERGSDWVLLAALRDKALRQR